MKNHFKTMKNYLIILSIALTGCVSQNRDTNLSKTEYYSKLTGIISPYMEYNPRGEMDFSNVGNNPYYKVVYNSEGNISEISYFNYGENSNDSYFGTHKVKYERYPDSLIRSYFDSNDKNASMSRHYYGGGVIHKEVFTLEPSGTKKTLVFKDTIGERIVTGFGTYEYLWKTKEKNQFEQEQYKKDGTRNLLTTYFPFYKSSITIDKKGHLYSITNLDTITNSSVLDKNAGYATVIFNFDQFGNEKGWSFHDVDQKLVNRKLFAGMEYGYAKVVYDFEWKNERLGLSKSFAMKFMNNENKPVVSNDSIHSTFFKFDDKENLVSLAYFDVDDQPILHIGTGYHKLELSYDLTGKQNGITRFDADGNLIE